MNVLGICPTKNRHQHLEKLVACFMEQDYSGPQCLLIFNNAPEEQRLEIGDGLEWQEGNKKITLMNHPISLKGEPYKTVGEIYNDITKYISHVGPETLINHMDDDDIYLPDHFSNGVCGYVRGSYNGNKAYKPMQSYYRSPEGIALATNVLEPSIFVNILHILEHGYLDTNADSHHKWLQPLLLHNEIYVDPKGKPTFICDWGSGIPTWKTSGDPNNPRNFQNYSCFSKDCGDQVITPLPKEQLKKYYEIAI